MIGSSYRRVGLTVLALALATGSAALAQTSGTAPQGGSPPGQSMPNMGPQGMGGAPGGQGGGGEWTNDNVNRQAFREEMEQIRKEHEDLEIARDRLMDKCVNVSGMQATQCQQEKQELHERAEKLHERQRALHEKMEAERREHQEHMRQKDGQPGGPDAMRGPPPQGMAPQGSPPPSGNQ